MIHNPYSRKPGAGCWLVLLYLLHSDCVGLRADTHYVKANSVTPVSPYTNWATAARIIQQAVDVSTDGDTVLVTNGVYATGGRAVYGTMTNRVAVDRPYWCRASMGRK